MNKKELFEEYSVKRAIMILAFPTILSMLITIIYNMTDAFFVGQTGDTYQVAAISLINPINLILLAMGNIFGIGSGIYISRLLGKKEYDKIKVISSFGFYMGLIISIISGVLIIVFLDVILKIIGASENTYKYTKDYLTILAFGAPSVCLQILLAAIIRYEGSSKITMIGLGLGTILNIILDPIMILIFKWGVIGAAIATVIGNIASVIYFIIYLIVKRKNTYISLSIKYFSFSLDKLKNVVILGVPMATNNILMSYATTILNNSAQNYGDDVVASISIANRIVLVSALILAGLAQGTQPFISYNNSAKNYDRMNAAIRFSGTLAICLGTIFFILTLLFSSQIVGIFMKEVNSTNVIKYSSYYVKAFISSAPILGLLYLLMFTLQALGKTIQAIILSFCRQCILFTTTLSIGDYFFNLNGIVWAQPVADVFSLIIALFLYSNINKSLFNENIESKCIKG